VTRPFIEPLRGWRDRGAAGYWARLNSKVKPRTPSLDHPEAANRHCVRGVVRRGLQPLPSKASISLRVDADVPEWFNAQGPGYQTRINTVLRAFRDASA
jgi:uncharacterized protein (DUF4415 family)